MVYVLSKEGKPLMPTKRHGKVRILLKKGLAKVVKRKPFTIKLKYETSKYTQPITLGIDSGYTYIGFSAITNKEELICGEVTLLSGQVERLKERSMYRKIRRSNLRYRAPRFNNRTRCEGWLAPSIKHKYDSHIRFIALLSSILPVTSTVVEVAAFDTQKIKNAHIKGKEYQEGEQKDFYNLRDYIFFRDNYTCQLCKAKDVPLEVHHIGYWKKDRSNRPSNLMALCVKCHIPKNHKEGKKLWGLKSQSKTLKEATFMSTVRWRLVNTLSCRHTYGYDTKSKRIALGLGKSHHADAFCIADGVNQVRKAPIFFEQVKRNNRSLEKFYDAKYIDVRTGKKECGKELGSQRRERNLNIPFENNRIFRGEKVSKGKRTIRKERYFYQPKDLVKYEDKVFTVKGTHNKGTRVMLKENNKSISVKELIPYVFRKGFTAI